MKLPREVIIGKNVLERVPEVCGELRLGKKVLIVTGETTYRIAGGRLASLMNDSFEVEIEKIGEASEKNVKNVVDISKKIKADFIIAAGGGRVIDVAKLASKIVGIEFVSIPTAASHDGIASAIASIKNSRGVTSRAAEPPIAVVADTEIIKSSPYRLLASGCGDVISKYTSVKDWMLAKQVKDEEISEYSIAMSEMAAEIIVQAENEIPQRGEAAIRKVIKALISCGVAMSIAGSSRPASGSEHKFSHALDILTEKPALHGEQCAVGSIMAMYLHGGDWREVRDALKNIGAPTTAEELDIDSRLIVDALVSAKKIKPHRYTILEHLNINKDKAEKAARYTGVIE